MHYLARYTHRVAISNHRLLSVSPAEVRFRWKDYAHNGRQRELTLPSQEFLRRFVQHVLPRGFPRVRYFGFLANRRRARMLPLCRALLHQDPPVETPVLAASPRNCPRCHQLMHLVERMTAAQLFFADKKERQLLDSSWRPDQSGIHRMPHRMLSESVPRAWKWLFTPSTGLRLASSFHPITRACTEDSTHLPPALTATAGTKL